MDEEEVPGQGEREDENSFLPAGVFDGMVYGPSRCAACGKWTPHVFASIEVAEGHGWTIRCVEPDHPAAA